MAKNIFGVSNTSDHIDGNDLIIRINSEEVLGKLDQIEAEARTLSAPYLPSRRLALLRTLSLSLALMCLVVGIFNAKNTGNWSFAGVFQASPYWLAAFFGLLVLSVVVIVIEHKRTKAVQSDASVAEWKERSAKAQEEAYQALQIPPDALSMDVFTATYAMKNGVPKNTTYTAFDFRAWVENDCLCLSDVENVVAIPLSALRGIAELPGRVTFYFWNKPESPDSETYRQYHIRKTYFGAYSVAGVRRVHIQSESGEYELLLPPYELDAFLRLTKKEIRKEESGAE